MGAVQLRIFILYTTTNKKNLAPKVCSKKIFQIVNSGFLATKMGFAHMSQRAHRRSFRFPHV